MRASSRKPPSTSTRAIASFVFEAGSTSSGCFAIPALRIRASMSAMGSVIVIAISYLRPERHAEVREQRLAFGVVPRAGAHGHVEPRDLLDVVVVHFGEDDLFADAERVV